MPRECVPEPGSIYRHVAVKLDHNILVFDSQYSFWVYNLYTEQWKEYVDKKWCRDGHTWCHLSYDDACAAVIGQDVYMFGGRDRYEDPTNALRKLHGTPQGLFFWTRIKTKKAKSPSPRRDHSGWEYDGKLWTFGGNGPSLVGYLNDNGNYDLHCNNQLLCFCPSTAKWTNPQCHGAMPPPVRSHATTTINDKVWLHGGFTPNFPPLDLYELDMSSLTWALIAPVQPRPKGRYWCSLTAISDSELLLHGGIADSETNVVLKDTWIFNVETLSWKQYRKKLRTDAAIRGQKE